jgi:hypothetical protein
LDQKQKFIGSFVAFRKKIVPDSIHKYNLCLVNGSKINSNLSYKAFKQTCDTFGLVFKQITIIFFTEKLNKFSIRNEKKLKCLIVRSWRLWIIIVAIDIDEIDELPDFLLVTVQNDFVAQIDRVFYELLEVSFVLQQFRVVGVHKAG